MIEKADESRLTNAQIKRYQEYEKEYQACRMPVLNKAVVYASVIGWLAACVIGFRWVGVFLSKGSEHSDIGRTLAQWALFFVVVGGPFVLFQIYLIAAEDVTEKRKKIERYVKMHLAQSYRSNSASSSFSTRTSKRRMQHEWYEDHNELNWQDRQTAEMYGLDVDTYISNVLEAD